MRPVREKNLHLFEHDPAEKLITEIHRHSIGVLLLLFNAVFLILLVLALLFYSLRYKETFTDSYDIAAGFDIGVLAVTIAVLLIILIIAGSAIAIYVYTNNYIIITDQKLILVSAKNLFARRVSQLSIGDVQDITVDQLSLLSRIFNYGTINIETAGEQAHFTFTMAEGPHECGKCIVDAHEQNLKLYGN
ncbi:MAG TPA: PH domain-containing protein [Candidatus Saccharimonadales bacterium]